MIELNKYKLGDLGFFFGGVTSIKKEDYGHGTPFLPYKNVYKNSKVDINELELMNVRPLDLDRRSGIYGDIFFTASSETPDEVAMSSVLLDEVENLTYNGFCKRFRLNDFETLLPEYARYLFRDVSFRREVYNLATGDIRFNISQESLANIEIEIPDVPNQRQIAQILTSLDDKIEINLQMNQTLEAMAQAIFKEWFVNFNFPGFDGELVDGLPKGWKKGNLGEIISFKNGKSSPERSDDFQYPVFGSNGIIGYSENFNAIENISIIGRVGSFCGSTYLSTKKCWVTDNAIIAQSKNNYSISAYLTLLNLNLNNFRAGSGQPLLNQTILSAIPVNIPNKELLEEFENQTMSYFKKIELNLDTNKGLENIRNTTLPKLMSGQLEIANN
jgi:type I restriction enzyme, S subunit